MCTLPPVLEVIGHGEMQFAQGFETNSSGLGAIETVGLIDVATSALRALILLGYYPLSVEFATPQANGAARIVVDLNGLTLVAADTPLADPHNIWTSANTDLTLAIGVIPFWGPGLQPATFHLPFPSSNGSWFVVPPEASPTGRPDPLLHRSEVVFTIPAGMGGDNLPGALEALAIAPFRNAVVATLVPLWRAGIAPGSSGLLFLFDPDQWFHAEFDHNLQSRVIRRIGEHGLLPASASADQIQTFLESQLRGDMLAEQVLLMATDRETRSRSRARRLVRALRKWSEREDWLSSGSLAQFQVAVDTLGWMDLLMLMGELNAFTYPALFDSGIISVNASEDDLVPANERLIGVRISDHAVALCWYGMGDSNGSEEQSDPYGEILRMAIPPDLAIPDPENPAAVLSEARLIDECCTWEFIPANSENPQPRLVVVAAPGVTVTRHANLEFLGLTVEVHRKNDFLLPPWGAPIQLNQIFAPEVIRLAEPDQFNSAPAAFVILHEAAKTTIHFYQNFPSPGTSEDQSQLEQPRSSVIIELLDPLSPDCGYRIDADFIKFTGPPLPPEPGLVMWKGMIRVIKGSANVRISLRQEVAQNLQWFFYETHDLNTLYRTRPDFIPLEIQYPVYDPATDVPLPTWTEAERLSHGLQWHDIPADLIEDTTPLTNTLMLMVFDVAVGFTPVGDVIDIAEFAYAYNTGFDRWGRPVRGYELLLMGAGAGMPFVSSSLVRGADEGLGAISRLWHADVDDATREAAEHVMREAKAGQNVLGALDDILQPLISGVGEVTGKTALELGDLLNATSRGFINPALQRAYRKWRALDFPDVMVVP